jgi:hypothetical protein
MKVIVHPDGEVSFETDDVGQALAMVKALRNGASPPKPPARREQAAPEEEVPVSAVLAQTWEWLVAHDGETETGWRATDVAAALGIQKATATYRLSQLVKKGLAHRLRRAHYRAGEVRG